MYTHPAQSDHHMVVVVGASAGGVQALKTLVAQLSADLPAPVFIANHVNADSTGDVLVRAIDAAGPLPCRKGTDGDSIQIGQIYLAPSDRHMQIEAGQILVTQGARENRYRPAIDPPFRSAAVAYGNRVIGVILTVFLDDVWQDDFLRYRCHTGHAYSSAELVAAQFHKIEETLWTALRMFKERQNLMATMTVRPDGRSARSLDAQTHIDRIRSMIKANDSNVDCMKETVAYDQKSARTRPRCDTAHHRATATNRALGRGRGHGQSRR